MSTGSSGGQPDNTQRSVIVTGGAGGMGSLTCERLAALGHSVVVADSNAEGAERRAGELVSASPSQRHVGVGGDLTMPESNRAAVSAATELGTVSVVVNAIGISAKNGGGRRPSSRSSPRSGTASWGSTSRLPS